MTRREYSYRASLSYSQISSFPVYETLCFSIATRACAQKQQILTRCERQDAKHSENKKKLYIYDVPAHKHEFIS